MKKIYFYVVSLLLIAACNGNDDLKKRAYELSSKSEKEILDKFPIIHSYDSILTYKSNIDLKQNNLISRVNFLNSVLIDSLEKIDNFYRNELNIKMTQLDETYQNQFDTLKNRANQKLNELNLTVDARLIRGGATDCHDKGNFTVAIYQDYQVLFEQSYYNRDSYSIIEIQNIYRMIDLERLLNNVLGEYDE